MHLHSIDPHCDHKKLMHIGYTGSLPAITGEDNKYYDAFCETCEQMVYAQTGRHTVPWTIHRNIAFGDASQKHVLNNNSMYKHVSPV